MRRFARDLCLVAAATLLPGCVSFRVPVKPPQGLVYTHCRAPLTTQFSRTPATHSRVGRAGTFYLLIPMFVQPPLVLAWNDASAERAAANGHLSIVHYVDHEFTQILGIFGHYETIAYGE